MSLSGEEFINLLPNEKALVRPVESVIPAHCPEDSPINNLSNTTAASGKLIKVVEAAAADWLVVLIGWNLTDLRPQGLKLSTFAPSDDCQDKGPLFGSYGAERPDAV